MFGWDETIECIEPIGVKGANDEPLCLAHKHGKLFVVAGVWVRDDGYVLGNPANSKEFYHWPEAAQLSEWQSAGLIPKQLPGYSISAIDYAFGYSLWIIIAGLVALALVKRQLTKRRQARDAMIPVTYGPPEIVTDGDRWIHDTVAPMLASGEQVQHQAIATPDADNTAHVLFIALTTKQLIIIHSKRKLFKVLFEAQKVEQIVREQITNAREMNYEITLSFSNGNTWSFFVPVGEKGFSNQRLFVRDVPRILQPQQGFVGVPMPVG